MKIYNSIDEFIPPENPVVTTGTFDGVHLGHRQIIRRLKEAAERTGGETVLLTFFPHPRMVLFPDKKQLLLTTPVEKNSLLEETGVDHLIVHPFTREFSMLSSDDFIKNILVKKLGTKKLVIGYNHHFGRDREGSFENLRKSGPVYGFEVEEIPAHEVDNEQVSSTKIREALNMGEVKTAETLLGYRYSLSGNVVKGDQRGRTIGFPTANIRMDDSYKLIPADGVYAVMVKRGEKKYKGMLNIGMRPTVNGKERTVEVNLLGFNSDIYGETLTITFVERLRNEMKFTGLDALKKQIEMDQQATIRILENEKG